LAVCLSAASTNGDCKALLLLFDDRVIVTSVCGKQTVSASSVTVNCSLQKEIGLAFKNNHFQAAVKMLQLGHEPPQLLPEEDSQFLSRVLAELGQRRHKSARK
jgi:hypothetical protein